MSPCTKPTGEQLRSALSLQRARFEQVRAEFKIGITHVPTGLPLDRVTHRKQVGSTQRAARERWQFARQRFDDFVILGIVPDDLK